VGSAGKKLGGSLLIRQTHGAGLRRARDGGRPGVEKPILEQVTRAKHQAETEAILAALNTMRWNRKKAAALLKIDYKALLYKMKKLGIQAGSEREMVNANGDSGAEAPAAG
jgi:DNA-binding NtrC family response regulator